MSYFAFDRTARRGVCRLGIALTLFSGLVGNIVPQSTNENAPELRFHFGIDAALRLVWRKPTPARRGEYATRAISA